MMQGLCRFNGLFFGLFRDKGLLALRALNFPAVGYHHQSSAIWTGLRHWFLPGCEITGRIIGTAKENAALARFSHHDVAAVLRTYNSDFFKPWFSMPAGWEIAAADKFTKTAITDHQFIPTIRASPAHLFRSRYPGFHFPAQAAICPQRP